MAGGANTIQALSLSYMNKNPQHNCHIGCTCETQIPQRLWHKFGQCPPGHGYCDKGYDGQEVGLHFQYFSMKAVSRPLKIMRNGIATTITTQKYRAIQAPHLGNMGLMANNARSIKDNTKISIFFNLILSFIQSPQCKGGHKPCLNTAPQPIYTP